MTPLVIPPFMIRSQAGSSLRGDIWVDCDPARVSLSRRSGSSAMRYTPCLYADRPLALADPNLQLIEALFGEPQQPGMSSGRYLATSGAGPVIPAPSIGSLALLPIASHPLKILRKDLS